MTVLEVISKSGDFLARKGVESPRLQTELLLAHVLQLPRMKLYLNFERQLTEPELDSLRQLVQRRGQRQPLQHIVGSTSFCGLEIRVNPQVLIPRPETELLAEAGWQFLASFDSRPTAALDFGTGSGCIAIALASKHPNTRVVAVDISAAALETARLNAHANGVADRVDFRLGNAFAAINAGEKFDLLISNPPYIPSPEIATLAPEVRDHDPQLALDGGADGLDFYRRLAQEAAALLQPEGKLMVEFGAGQADAVAAILTAQGWIVESIRPDYASHLRYLVARAPAAAAGPGIA